MFKMKTLLRKRTTGSYFQTQGQWTNSEHAAFDFKLTERAIRFVREAGLDTSGLELILAFDDPSFNITVPIDERFQLPATEAKSNTLPGAANTRAVEASARKPGDY